MRIRLVAVLAGLIVLACSLGAAERNLPPLPDQSGPSTCVAVYERQADGPEKLVGISMSPSFKGEQAELRNLMDTHVRHAIQFVGRGNGKTEIWLAAQLIAPITFSPSPEYTRAIGDPGGGGTICWCASPARDPFTGKIIGCEFPCGACEHCVVTATP